MRLTTRTITITFVCLIVGCTDPDEARRQFLLTEMQQMQNSYAVVSRELNNQNGQIAGLEQRLQKQRQELADYKRGVNAYMMNHKMAIAALAAGAGGAAVAYDPNNEFSNEVQGTAALVGLVAGLWALDNMDEVIEVADQLTQADQYVKQLNSQIDTTENELHSAQTPVASMQDELTSLQQSYEAAKTEYESLE